MKPIKCRICLMKTKHYSSLLATHHLFKQKLTLMDYIEKVASVQLQLTDEDSRCICENCVGKLGISFEFIENVRRAENYLSLLNDHPGMDAFQGVVVKKEKVDVDVSNNSTLNTCRNCNVTFNDELERDKHAVLCDVGPNTHMNETERIKTEDNEWTVKNEIPLITDDWNTLESNSSGSKNKSKGMKFCSLCEKDISVRNQKAHNTLHHQDPDGSYSCNQCERKFPTCRLLKHHKANLHDKKWRKPSSDKTRPCIICNVEKNMSELRTHILTHKDEEGKLTCPKCGIKKATYRLVQLHLNNVHVTADLMCPHCGEMFPTRSVFRGHLRKHATDEEKLKCEFCPKVYLHPSHLSYHVQNSHSTEKNYACNMCERKYGSKPGLNNHIKEMHTIQNHCKCDVCGREFTSKKLMKKHAIYHMKPTLKCVYCNAMFHVTSKLNLHMYTHTGEKPLKCAFCDQAFIQHASLKLHVTKHHPGADYQKCLKKPTDELRKTGVI